MISGTVNDESGGIIPRATVTVIDEATDASRTVTTNDAGLYAFPSLVPGTYTLRVSAKGFEIRQITGIVLHASEQRTVAALTLRVGAETQTVSVQATTDMTPVDNGQRIAVLDSEQIDDLALQGRDTTELLKILPGATTVSGGITQTAPMFSDINITVQESSVGNGIDINGAVNRGGTALLSDGANVIDPGNMASAVSIINPEMTQEVTVQASNFGADVPLGPVVVSTISKSGTASYHGEAYFDARNNVLNANDWFDNHNNTPQGDQHYYYPGGNLGGPVPGTHHNLLFWGGYERWLQNQGNGNTLKSYIPTPEMMAGDFTMDNPDNAALCPNGFFGSPQPNYPEGNWCNDLSGTFFPDGSSVPVDPDGTVANNGRMVPKQFLDPGAAALATIWPKANTNPATNAITGYNYIQPIENINDGWLYRVRLDYNLGGNTKIYGSYQEASDSELAQGNGAHIYWTPGNAIPYPGGGISEFFSGKNTAAHFVHNFNNTTTMDLMAAWSFGSFPFVQPNPSKTERATLGYSYGKVFQTPPVNIPAYGSGGAQTFPDFSQNSIFENPLGSYAVRKEAPQFGLNITKVWGRHTVKMGGFTQNTDNFQSSDATFQDGSLTFAGGASQDHFNPAHNLGSGNRVASFVMGIVSGYSENDSSPIADTAYQATAGFVDDTWKATPRLTLELGVRIEHVGHWYDRDHIGMAVFYPQRVLSDYNSGKVAPGYYWHAIDAGVPLSGQPNRFAYFNPRLGFSYDVFGAGRTIVRGGWGSYRFVTQVNDVSSPLVTAQSVKGFSFPGQQAMVISQTAGLSVPVLKPGQPTGVSGAMNGFDPTDYSQPVTYAYNFAIDQRLAWNSQLEVAYVGSQTSQLSDDSEGIEGANFASVADQNKTPLGAFFKPDPVTGVLSTNPENLAENPTGTGEVATNNVAADYRPYGYAYGTAAATMIQGISYTNYNALQVSWIRSTGRFTYNLNGTWSKALGTSLQQDPFSMRDNYAPTSIDRPLVFNASYAYRSGLLHLGNSFINLVGSGWTISGISTWQAGSYLPSAGGASPNFSLGFTYVNTPGNANAQGIGTGVGTASFYGTDAAGLLIRPVLTCNPTSHLAHYQLVNSSCFAAPAFGTFGGQGWPYMRGSAYFNNDLALYRTFHIHEQQNVQFRLSAFNWLNHPLTQFSGNGPLTLSYLVDYNSKQVTGTNFKTAAFGVMDQKSGFPYQRILELNVKYFF